MAGWTNRGKYSVLDWAFRGATIPTNFYVGLVTSAVAPTADINTFGELTEIQEERLRRNQHCSLIDCLQLSDKARIAIEQPQILEVFGFASKRSGKQAIKSWKPDRYDDDCTTMEGAVADFPPNVICGYCAEDLDENGLFPEEAAQAYSHEEND